MKRIILTAIFLLSFPLTSHSDVITLTSGEQIHGTIVTRDAESVKVDTGVGVNITYYLDEISYVQVDVQEEIVVDVPVVEVMETADDVNEQSQRQVPVPKVKEKHYDYHESKSEVDRLMRVVDEQTHHVLPQTKDFVKETDTDDIKAMIGTTLLNVGKKVTSKAENVQTKVLDLSENIPDIYETIRESNKLSGGDIFFFLLLYGLFSFLLMKIANKLKINNAWLAWVPILQLFLVLQMAEKPWWWFILVLIPIIGFILTIVIWVRISQRLKKPAWFGALMMLPVVNFFVLIYFALPKSKRKPIRF